MAYDFQGGKHRAHAIADDDWRVTGERVAELVLRRETASADRSGSINGKPMRPVMRLMSIFSCMDNVLRNGHSMAQIPSRSHDTACRERKCDKLLPSRA